MKALRFVSSLPLGLALGITGCPGDDGGATGTDAATEPTGPSTSSSPTSESNTTPTSSDPTTSQPTTEPTTEATSSGSSDESGSESGTTTGELECPYRPVDGTPSLMLEQVADGFDEALLVVGDPVDKDVLYVLQKGGEIKRLDPGVTAAPKENWMDFDVLTSSEQGLLGLAFHPDYENDPRIYVAYTPSSAGGDVMVTEFMVNDGVPDVSSARDVIGFGDPQPNHNGGMIQFGLDDLLYISMGDGGPQNNACGHAQNGDVLMGKIIRIDPEMDGAMDMTPGCPGGGECTCSGAGPFDYTIPGDNPFVGDDGIRDEIYALGFRNPWRMSIDPIDGRLWVGDVGQDAWEEVSVIEAGDNAGWSEMEGAHCFGGGGCDEAGLTGLLNADNQRMPVAEFENGPGNQCAMIGLGNYRSCEVPAWDGLYFYGDACTGQIWAVSFDGTTVTDVGMVGQVENALYGGGYNAYGDVFVASASDFGSAPIFRIAPAP